MTDEVVSGQEPQQDQEAQVDNEQVAKEAFALAAQKLPILTKFVVRHDFKA